MKSRSRNGLLKLSVICICCYMVLISATTQDYNCTFSSKSVSYNLSSIHYVVGFEGKNHFYVMNVCGVVENHLCQRDLEGGPQSICQYSVNDGEFVAGLGYFDNDNKQPFWSLVNPDDPYAGVQYEFLNGDICWKGGREYLRKVTVIFICDPKSMTQLPAFIVENPQCEFSIFVTSPAACAIHTGS